MNYSRSRFIFAVMELNLVRRPHPQNGPKPYYYYSSVFSELILFMYGSSPLAVLDKTMSSFADDVRV